MSAQPRIVTYVEVRVASRSILARHPVEPGGAGRRAHEDTNSSDRQALLPFVCIQ